jgi:hypothetical protein
MALDKDMSVPKKGMNRDTAPFELTKEEYSFALNANFHDEHGSGKVVLQNEGSNVKCTGFKNGYVVVGHKYDVVSEQTFFFLTNPTTGFSEIGFIESIQEALINSPVEEVVDGNIRVVLETPLEQTPQVASCVYTTIISDLCNSGSQTGSKCLNFSIDDPFHPNNIYIKHGKTGVTLWFTHLRNPQRYIELENLDKYTNRVNNCDDASTDICLDCEKMRVFPLYEIPCLYPRIIQSGGNLPAGTNEVLIAHSDFNGNETSDYFAITNPIPIFDKNNLVLDQSLLGYKTNQAIAIDVIGVDTDFEYFKIAVIHRSGLDAATTVYNYGVYPINQTTVTIYDFTNKEVMDMQRVISRRPFYDRAKGLTVANDYLYQYGLKTQRTINLQPIANLLGAMAQWSTYQAKEDLYEDGIAISNYQSGMRDEVYPYAIKFQALGGYELPLTPFIARPAIGNEMDEVGSEDYPENAETSSVLEYNPECFGNARDKRWQFENTAFETDDCLIEGSGIETITVEKEIEAGCYITEGEGDIAVLATIESSSLIVPEGTTDIVTYIAANTQEIINGSGTNGADIRDILDDPTEYDFNCTPYFGDNCSEEIELVSEEMFPIDVATQTVSQVEKPLEDYTPAVANSTPCNIFSIGTDGNLERDTDFETDFMLPGEIVYKRLTPTNNNCNSASEVVPLTNPQSDNSNFLVNKGEATTFATLQDTRTTTTTRSIFQVRVTGTGGTANIQLGAFNYVATWAGTLNATAAAFVTSHAATILTDTGLNVFAILDTIYLAGNYTSYLVPIITNLTLDLNGTYTSFSFTDKLHSNAVWHKVSFNGRSKVIFEVGTPTCSISDDNNGTSLRALAFTSCSATASTSGTIVGDIFGLNFDKYLELEAADFGGTSGTAYIAVDSVMLTREVSGIQINTLTPPCNCFSVFQRDVETSTLIEYTDLTFGKKQVWKSLCEFSQPVLGNCEAVPYKKGEFAYVESTEVYPCNKELFDSSVLKIKPADIPTAYRTKFEDYYVTGGSASPSLDGDGNYVLVPDTDFRDKPIRHFKYPDNTVAPFMSYDTQSLGDFQKAIIYPIGFHLPVEAINAFLDIAVQNGLLTPLERSKIVSYEIFRGDRRTQKSVIAKGLLFDMWKYSEKNTTDLNISNDVYYSNYPLNSLGIDLLNGGLLHPFTSNSNNFFTFHSPDIHFEKPSLPREMRVEGYMFGNSANYFDEVRDHPTYVLLNQEAYVQAGILASAEVTFELILQTGDWLVLGGTGGLSAPISGALAFAAAASIIYPILIKWGEYRYKWLETYRNLGQPQNFAYYQASMGYYNLFKANTVQHQITRGLTVSTYIKEGFLEVAEELSTPPSSLRVNQLDREYTVALKTGAYNVNYPPDYIGYDNALTNPNNASRRTAPTVKGKSTKIVGNAASPYASLKQYSPAQYGSIDSVSWMNTGFCGNLNGGTDCDAAFGLDVFISRFAMKRKLPFFRTTAFGLAPLTPFKYSDYFNINPDNPTSPFRKFIDYEIMDDQAWLLYSFPTKKSKYQLDGLTGTTFASLYYINPPAKFYLYSYGIPYFLVESEINCNFRYAKREKHEDFYPNKQDIIELTQETNVSIRQPNTYFYNKVYSLGHSYYPYRTLPLDYSKEVYDKLNDLSNVVIYSAQDVSETDKYLPWLRYKALDMYDFKKSYGDLVSVVGLESMQLMARFTNGFTIYGAIDQIRDRLTPDTQNLGNGGIFAGRPVNFNVTDLGHAGTQHNILVSCEYGHFWADAKRGKIFQLAPNGKEMNEVSKPTESVNDGLEKWFKENLPFKILQYYPSYNIDNNYKGVGLTMMWDDRFKRLFVTKMDYIPISNNLLFFDNEIYRTNGYEDIIAEYEEDGYTYEGINGANLEFYRPEGECAGCDSILVTYTLRGEDPVTVEVENVGDEYTTDEFKILKDGTDWIVQAIEESPTSGCDCIVVNYSGGTINPTFLDVFNGKNRYQFTHLGNIYYIQWDTFSNSWRLLRVTPTLSAFGQLLGSTADCPFGTYSLSAGPGNGFETFGFFEIVQCTEFVIYATLSEDTECPFGNFTIEDRGIFQSFSVNPIICQTEDTELVPLQRADFKDTDYFKPCSWTVAYSPVLRSWISYYSFVPNYYVAYNGYFQTGINDRFDADEFGLWSHFPYLSSNQVFYGKLYPFIIEYPINTKLTASRLDAIEYWLDIRKYYDKYNFTDIVANGFNKAVVYNSSQNTGQLKLVRQQDDDMRQLLQYPTYNVDSIEVLQTELNHKWSFNYLYNIIKNERAGIPIWKEDCPQIYKQLDHRLLGYTAGYKDYLRGDYFLVRLIQDAESRYKYLFRLATDERDFYNQ